MEENYQSMGVKITQELSEEEKEKRAAMYRMARSFFGDYPLEEEEVIFKKIDNNIYPLTSIEGGYRVKDIIIKPSMPGGDSLGNTLVPLIPITPEVGEFPYGIFKIALYFQNCDSPEYYHVNKGLSEIKGMTSSYFEQYLHLKSILNKLQDVSIKYTWSTGFFTNWISLIGYTNSGFNASNFKIRLDDVLRLRSISENPNEFKIALKMQVATSLVPEGRKDFYIIITFGGKGIILGLTNTPKGVTFCLVANGLLTIINRNRLIHYLNEKSLSDFMSCLVTNLTPKKGALLRLLNDN